MQNSLRQALQACATFDFVGDNSNAKKLAILPGIYSTMKTVTYGEGKTTDLTFSSPTNLVNAGYSCDQVADDYNANDSGQYVQVTGVGRTKFRDFLNTVQRVGIKVTKIVIQNKVSSQNIYDQEIEIARTAIGAKGAMDFIQLQQYVDVNAYDRSKITIDLSGTDANGYPVALELTPEVFVAINVPAQAHFTMQFYFEAPAYN